MQVNALDLKHSKSTFNNFCHKKRDSEHSSRLMNSLTAEKVTPGFHSILEVIRSPEPSKEVVWPNPDITHQNLDDFIAQGSPPQYPFDGCRRIEKLYLLLLQATGSVRKEIKLNGEFVCGGFLYTISQWNKFKTISSSQALTENKKRYEALPLIKAAVDDWLKSNSIEGIETYSLGIRGSLSQGLSNRESDVDLTFSYTGNAEEKAVDEMISTLRSHLATTLKFPFEVEIKRLW